ncbi:hypothetical protein [Pseudomonas asiatica]|uniref:hypothetical protein n=1 Tax=Pseudomonas asiatica TaxID=2219225 RepID=UPI0037C73789
MTGAIATKEFESTEEELAEARNGIDLPAWPNAPRLPSMRFMPIPTTCSRCTAGCFVVLRSWKHRTSRSACS